MFFSKSQVKSLVRTSYLTEKEFNVLKYESLILSISTYNTFHFHNCFIRNILVSCRSLGFQTLLISFIARKDNHSSPLETLERASFALLGSRVNIGLENWENCNFVTESLPDMSHQRSTRIQAM